MDQRADFDYPGPAATTAIRRPIHYLGSKLRVLGPIIDLLDQLAPERQRVCDLFAGSGVVSAALAASRPVTAVDIQEYSRVLCTALLRPAQISILETEAFLSQAGTHQLRSDLMWATSALLDHETRALEDASKGQAEGICGVIEGGSVVAHEMHSSHSMSPRLSAALEQTCARLRQLDLDRGPRAVALRHFGGVYFSYSQSIELAVLLDLAHACTSQLKERMLAATLSSASEIVNTVGKQFAQPIRPTDSTGKPKTHLVQKILRDRKIDVLTTFESWLARYSSCSQPNFENRTFRADYSVALSRHCDDVGVVYADPPYTRDHYSRFYHALETMCLRDDPDVAATHPTSNLAVGRGVYRTDRHQSPFCIVSQAPDAFAKLFRGVKRLSVPLLLSYSPLAKTTKPRPRVIETSDLVSLARAFFKRVELLPAGRISHNKLNKRSLNSERCEEGEVFLVCS